MQSKKKLQEEFKKHPQFVRAYIQHSLVWWGTHLKTRSRKNFRNVYDLFYHNVFCSSYADYRYRVGLDGFLEPLDTKKFLEDYFKITLP